MESRSNLMIIEVTTSVLVKLRSKAIGMSFIFASYRRRRRRRRRPERTRYSTSRRNLTRLRHFQSRGCCQRTRFGYKSIAPSAFQTSQSPHLRNPSHL